MITAVARAEVFELAAGPDLVGQSQFIHSKYADTFIDLGRLHNLGYEELRAANPEVDPWLPGEGTGIVLPTEYVLPRVERDGIVINLAEYRVYYFYGAEGQSYVATLPASIGRMDWETPLGTTSVAAKVHRPTWYPPESVRLEYAAEGRKLDREIPPGPENPLGDYALRLSLAGYLIHGTNKPAGVGMRVTHGCIRLFPEDIEWLYTKVGVATPVQFINQPVKFGWKGNELYLEVHPELADADAAGKSVMTLLTEEYVFATQESEAEADWELIADTFREKTGIPVRVGVRRGRVSSLAQNSGNPSD
ncbi:MAG: L,D-transpeptidase family protein [Gammaproteobacteria bacterium]|jgi:L,D-transpeptidase ErfK/SrfK|nr:L,D-transpeptidase family protein [Gammaproteobacteria bacterium]